MPAEPLTMFEREEIRAGLERNETLTELARRLNRHRCTISSEVNRNGGRAVYRAVDAQARADAHRSRPKTPILQKDPVLAAHVQARLELKDSPMTIAKELAAGTYAVTGVISHETIYSGIYAQGRCGLRRGLHVNLHRSRRCRKRRTAKAEQRQRKSPLGAFKPIADRPAVAGERSEPGHLEGDLILGAGNRSAIITVFDRATRTTWLADLPEDHGAASTLAGLIELCERIAPQYRKTLTWDQGREMARWAELEAACNIEVYFADPHHPWQRPTNENGNGLLRRYVGKGTDLSKFTPADLRRIETRLNTMPRRIFQWKSSQDIADNGTLRATR